MRKVAVVVTARPSYARIKTALRAIDAHPELELQLVVAASALLERYGKVSDVIEADGFRPDAYVHMVLEGENPLTAAKTLGIGVGELASVFDRLGPDCVISVADRYETLATAIAASYQNIPVVHVQGGEITGNIDEKVRHAVTKLADRHCVANESAAGRVNRMGESWDTIHVTGCPSVDLAAQVRDQMTDSDLLAEVGLECDKGVGVELSPFGPDYLIAMQHPVTYEWGQSGQQVTETLRAVDCAAMPCFWFWPNIDAGADLASKAIREYREEHHPRHIRFLRSMPPEPFLWLLAGAKAIIGNSSVAIREGSFLGTPAINIGSRQAGRDMGPNVKTVGHNMVEIVKAIHGLDGRFPSSNLYGEGRAGLSIAEILASRPLTTEKKLAY